VGDGGAKVCVAAATDDGTSAAASLSAGGLECAHRTTRSSWSSAVGHCAGLGGGFRLPTKAEALRIASNPLLCRTALPANWYTWTSSCAGAGLAWWVYFDGNTGSDNTDTGTDDAACCVR
jgi:hypothetical protein